ncbi:hypothetical protein HQ531_03005 [bacterium]|nr:hypothetical protein [bacterium]
MIRKIINTILLFAVFGSAQEIPIQEPRLLPLPSISGGVSYFALIPTKNLQLDANPVGWTVADTMHIFSATFDAELVRYRWWDHFFAPSNFDAYSSLGYSIFNQLGSLKIPGNYPSSFQMNNVLMSGFSMNALIKEFYLEHHLVYQYSRRGTIHASLGTGLTHLSLYKNGAGIRLLESDGLGLHFGIGWKTTLMGRNGERIRIGLDLGYSLRSFDLTQQDENLKLSDGSSGFLSPLESISLNTPDLKLDIEFGEALYAAFTPYRDPFKLGLIKLSAGSGWINYQDGVTIQYDSTGRSISIPFLGKVSQNYDLQFFKYNWPFHFIRQANIDIFSGIGIRYWKTSKRIKLPDGWAHQLTDGSSEFSGLGFAPRFIDIYLDHEIIYPLGQRLHADFNAGTGFASMTLYENEILNHLIDATSITWKLGGGLGYTVQGDGSSKVLIGLNLDYYHQRFEIDMSKSNLSAVNPEEIIPITTLDLSQPTLSLSIGLIFGGHTNDAYKAHTAFREKHYTKALKIQRELLQSNPEHHNGQAILLQEQEIEDSLVNRYYRDVEKILFQGKLENALALINRGETPPGDAGVKAVRKMKVEIADRALARAADALKNLDYELAEEMIILALKSDPSSMEIAKVLLSRAYIIRATILYQSGVYGRSLYWLKQADGLSDRYKLVTADLRHKIGDGRIDDANEGILKEDRKMVYESMLDAKALNPMLGDIVDEHLHDLEQAIEIVDEQQLGPLRRMALDNLLDDVQGLDPDNFSPRIGMKASLIARYIGPPKRQFKEGEYELWVYHRPEGVEVWLYLRDGVIEKIEHQEQ